MTTESVQQKKGKPERELLHPIVADWLTANGFEWWYEPILENRSRIDFIGKRGDETWLLECKIIPPPSRVVYQLDEYHKAYGDPTAKKVLCLPSSFAMTKLFLSWCNSSNIEILRFDGDFNIKTSTLPRRRVADEHPERCTGKIALHGELARLRGIEKRLLNDITDLYPIYELARSNDEGDKAAVIGVALDTMVNALGYDPIQKGDNQ